MPEVFAQPFNPSPVQEGPTFYGTKTIDIGNKSKVDVPFSIYKSIEGKSYSSIFFETTQDVEPIDNYVMAMIGKKEFKDSISSYEQIMSELFDKLNIGENTDQSVKYNKVIKYISMIGKVKTKEERRSDLIKRVKDAEKAKFEKKAEAIKSAEKKAEAKSEEMAKKVREYAKKEKEFLAKHEQLKSIIK